MIETVAATIKRTKKTSAEQRAAPHHVGALAHQAPQNPLKGKREYVRPDVLPFMVLALEAVDESEVSGKNLADAGAACPSTITSWRNFNTRSPQFATILGTLRACKKDLTVIDLKF